MTDIDTAIETAHKTPDVASNYLAYAGIGARKTPENILAIMAHVGAYLQAEGWSLRSGAAKGADAAFEAGAQLQASTHQEELLTEIHLPWKGFNNHQSHLHPGKIPFSEQEVELSAQYHPAWDKCSPSAKLLLQRNLRQILGCEAVNGSEVLPVKFVICWTENGALVGGTAQALRLAVACGIPIINFGSASSPDALEALVLQVDQLQNQFKKETN